MRILLLGKGEHSSLLPFFRHINVDVMEYHEPLTWQKAKNFNCQYLVSYGYRHILSKDVLGLFKNRAINLHISYLPWNRGADPNLWSFLTRTPAGVTIHAIDEGIDTGPIYVQRKIEFDIDTETLATTYAELSRQIEELFRENWQNIVAERIPMCPQVGKGSSHRLKDKEPYLNFLDSGWDTLIRHVWGKAL